MQYVRAAYDCRKCINTTTLSLYHGRVKLHISIFMFFLAFSHLPRGDMMCPLPFLCAEILPTWSLYIVFCLVSISVNSCMHPFCFVWKMLLSWCHILPLYLYLKWNLKIPITYIFNIRTLLKIFAQASSS